MTEKFTKEALRIVVAQICQTIGWNYVQSTAMEILVDTLHRNLSDIAKTTHQYADQFGRTQPNLNDLGLAFKELGIEIRELREYVEFVDSVPFNIEVPRYPVPKDSHLNFLKPGSQEVVTRPVHVHEHLPPTVELSIETTNDLGTSPQPSPTFKRPGDPIEVAAKRIRLGLEEEGRALREISSVMMTTGGFISPAREGKLPEPKLALPADTRSASPPAQHYPTVPPEVNREKKKKPPKEPGHEKEKPKKEKKLPSGDTNVKKLVNMKEVAKLKVLKNKPRLPSPEKSLIQKLAESPHLVVTPIPAEPVAPVAKLSTEPDRQKLNIFKKISKVKEEEAPAPPPPPTPPPTLSIVKDIEPGFSSPGSPSTPKTPDILRSRSPEHKKKKKKDKDREKKSKKEEREKEKEKMKIEKTEPEPDRRPKTPEIVEPLPPPVTPTFPFFPHGLIPPLPNPLIPRFPLPMGPNFPNLPLPPPHFMHPPAPIKNEQPEPVPASSTNKSPLAILLDREKKIKEHKKDKKEKKKKDKKDKPKKDKKEKKRPEDKHKSKEKKEKRKEKREKEREKEKEKVAKEGKEEVVAVPKLTIKMPPVEEKPPPKPESEPRPPSPEVARISSLFNRPSTAAKPPEQKPLVIQTESLKPVKDVPLQKSPSTIIDKDGNKIWICPSCGLLDDGTPMIGCDKCDAWYHWVCVGIQVPPDENEDWYCRFCIVKKQGNQEKKKRGRKKKPPV